MIPARLLPMLIYEGPRLVYVGLSEGVGFDHTLPVNRLHHTLPGNVLHHALPVNRLHHTLLDED